MRIEALTPLKVHMNGRDLLLDPGQPQDLPDEEARRLLAKVPNKVRVVPSDEPVVIEPAVRPDGSPLAPIYWEDNIGQILGPAVPEFVARAGGDFWIVTTFEGNARWIRSDRLRSKQAFDAQTPLQIVELIREPKLSPPKPKEKRRR